MVDESRRAEPELSAAFPGGIHHAEVVDPCPQHGAVSGTQLRDAAQQDLHPLPRKPTAAAQGAREQPGAHVSGGGGAL